MGFFLGVVVLHQDLESLLTFGLIEKEQCITCDCVFYTAEQRIIFFDLENSTPCYGHKIKVVNLHLSERHSLS